MKNNTVRLAATGIFLAFTCGALDAFAAPVECQSATKQVKAVTNPSGHQIATRFQLDSPNLQTLLSTTIEVESGKPSCLLARLSGLATIRDNYIVFQVRVDGVPMEGHAVYVVSVNSPVVFVAIDNTQDEQAADPTKPAAFNFFAEVGPGVHTVEVLAAAGSNIDFTGPLPAVNSLVLTLSYR